jgi:hypothetical protein
MTSISTVLRQRFKLQELPTRSESINQDTLSNLWLLTVMG